MSNSNAPEQLLRMPLHARANAPYSWRPPSPPPINIPHILTGETVGSSSLVTSYDNIDSSYLTEEDLRVIAADTAEMPRVPDCGEWKYESRRQAQLITNFLYLGPLTVARNREWLLGKAITMILVARDERQAAHRLLTVDEVGRELGIAVHYIDIAARHELVRHFPHMIRSINDHLIDVYRRRAARWQAAGGSALPSGPGGDGLGKVLVACETGSDRSPAVVAAYIMAVYGKDVGSAIKHIIVRRFCVSFDETIKQILRAWEDIVIARRQVSRAQREALAQFNAAAAAADAASPPSQAPHPHRNSKRRFEDTMGDGEHVAAGHDPASLAADEDRFKDRRAFTPFVDCDDYAAPPCDDPGEAMQG